MPARAILHFSPHGRPPPATLRTFAADDSHRVVDVETSEEVLARVSRAYPEAIFLDASEPSEEALRTCRALKAEPFTAVVPVVAYVDGLSEDAAAEALLAGADEVVGGGLPKREGDLRMRMALRRAERDVSVHPTTRLPGTVQIERALQDRLDAEEPFAFCYADLDHFKEFNDRYGYNHGDRVILILSRILRDVVRGRSSRGFVGHIGGDDFVFIVPYQDHESCCEDVLSVFDELIPLQYSPEDRERGHFKGKDRRGELYAVPLMTLSIGVISNLVRRFDHVGQVSELATEMKAYAKTIPGSVFRVDRRSGPLTPVEPEAG